MAYIINKASSVNINTNTKNLLWWNRACASIHFLQGVAAILYTFSWSSAAQKFRVPLLTHYAKWDQDYGPTPDTQTITEVPLAAVACVVPFLSFFAHLNMAVFTRRRYEADILNFANTQRWVEYAFSSTLMFFLICLLFSIYDISLLAAVSVMNITVMFCGYLMEQMNKKPMQDNQKPETWIPFIAGSFIGACQWAILYSTLTVTDDDMPKLIYAAIFGYFVLYMSFAFNMLFFYYKAYCHTDKHLHYYLYSERGYMILSLVSKTLLLWLILTGVNQPNAYTRTEQPTTIPSA